MSSPSFWSAFANNRWSVKFIQPVPSSLSTPKRIREGRRKSDYDPRCLKTKRAHSFHPYTQKETDYKLYCIKRLQHEKMNRAIRMTRVPEDRADEDIIIFQHHVNHERERHNEHRDWEDEDSSNDACPCSHQVYHFFYIITDLLVFACFKFSFILYFSFLID